MKSTSSYSIVNEELVLRTSRSGRSGLEIELQRESKTFSVTCSLIPSGFLCVIFELFSDSHPRLSFLTQQYKTMDDESGPRRASTLQSLTFLKAAVVYIAVYIAAVYIAGLLQPVSDQFSNRVIVTRTIFLMMFYPLTNYMFG